MARCWANTKRRYGLTKADFAELFMSQGRCCAICEKESEDGTGEEFSVDHDHATGKVRGILCQGCNTLLGFIEKDASRVVKTQGYLYKTGEQ